LLTTSEQLESALRALGIPYDPAQFEDIMDTYAPIGVGMTAAVFGHFVKAESRNLAFRMANVSGTGLLTTDELIYVLRSKSAAVSPESVAAVMERFSAGGEMSLREFHNMVGACEYDGRPMPLERGTSESRCFSFTPIEPDEAPLHEVLEDFADSAMRGFSRKGHRVDELDFPAYSPPSSPKTGPRSHAEAHCHSFTATIRHQNGDSVDCLLNSCKLRLDVFVGDDNALCIKSHRISGSVLDELELLKSMVTLLERDYTLGVSTQDMQDWKTESDCMM